MLKSLSLAPRFAFGILSVAALVPFAPLFTASASAQCVMIDVSTQLVIRGSKTPSTQENHVEMNAPDQCVGGAVVTTNAQTAVTPGNATQSRNSESSIINGMQNVPNLPGIGGPAIKIPVETKVDVYSPALDPTFMNQTFSGIPPSTVG